MSKSLKRVTTARRDAGLDVTPLETGAGTRTAPQAAVIRARTRFATDDVAPVGHEPPVRSFSGLLCI